MNYMYLPILSHTLDVPDLYFSKVTTVSFTDSTVTKKGTYFPSPPSLPSPHNFSSSQSTS